MACAQKHDFKVEEDAETREDAQALMECVLHGIDIGHPTFSWEEECRWARLVATEFQAQVRLRTNDSVSLCAGDGSEHPVCVSGVCSIARAG